MSERYFWGALLFALLMLQGGPAHAQGSVHNPLGRVLFTINLPYEVDAAGVLIPPGEYVIRDMGVQSQNLLSISCRDRFQSVALLHTTRRQLLAARGEAKDPKLVFDEENPARPVLKEIVVPGLDDYIVVAAVATNESDCAVAVPAAANLTVNQRVVVEEKKPEVVETPLPAPAQPEVKEVPPPVKEEVKETPPPPVKERKRVRKQ